MLKCTKIFLCIHLSEFIISTTQTNGISKTRSHFLQYCLKKSLHTSSSENVIILNSNVYLLMVEGKTVVELPCSNRSWFSGWTPSSGTLAVLIPRVGG